MSVVKNERFNPCFISFVEILLLSLSLLSTFFAWEMSVFISKAFIPTSDVLQYILAFKDDDDMKNSTDSARVHDGIISGDEMRRDRQELWREIQLTFDCCGIRKGVADFHQFNITTLSICSHSTSEQKPSSLPYAKTSRHNDQRSNLLRMEHVRQMEGCLEVINREYMDGDVDAWFLGLSSLSLLISILYAYNLLISIHLLCCHKHENVKMSKDVSTIDSYEGDMNASDNDDEHVMNKHRVEDIHSFDNDDVESRENIGQQQIYNNASLKLFTELKKSENYEKVVKDMKSRFFTLSHSLEERRVVLRMDEDDVTEEGCTETRSLGEEKINNSLITSYIPVQTLNHEGVAGTMIGVDDESWRRRRFRNSMRTKIQIHNSVATITTDDRPTT